MNDLAALKIDRRGKQQRKPRSTRRPWFFRGVVLLLLLALGWVFYRPIREFVDQFRLPQVRVAEVFESHPAEVGAVQGTAANGYIVAARRAALSADTPGRIIELNVTEGSVVEKGDVVARLYYEEYAAALGRAAAEAKAAAAEVVRARANLAAARSEQSRRESSERVSKAETDEADAAVRLAEARLARTSKLFEQELASADELDAAKTEAERAAARAASARARQQATSAATADAQHLVEVAAAGLRVAEARQAVAAAAEQQAAATLDKTFVRAPFDGIVVLKDAEVGEVVSPNSQGGSNARGSVCTMVDFASLEVQADVPETSIADVVVGAPANIYLDAFPERTYPGRVARIWPTANRQKASIEVRVVFTKRDRDLRPEMGVRVVFLPASAAGAEAGSGQATPAPAIAKGGKKEILVPADAVVEVDGKAGVFLVERGTARLQPVEVGERRAGRVTILSGLRPGRRIVLAPPPDLADGDRVLVLN